MTDILRCRECKKYQTEGDISELSRFITEKKGKCAGINNDYLVYHFPELMIGVPANVCAACQLRKLKYHFPEPIKTSAEIYPDDPKKQELHEITRLLRKVTKGSMDPLFEDIFEMEAFLKGKEPAYEFNRGKKIDDWIREGKRLVALRA